MEIRGTVHEIGATQQVTESFKKRDLILHYAENPEFPEYIKLESTQDRTVIFDKVKVGDEVEVSFNLRGRPWTNKDGVTTYFNSLVAWRITTLASSNLAPVEFDDHEPQDDDLPF